MKETKETRKREATKERYDQRIWGALVEVRLPPPYNFTISIVEKFFVLPHFLCILNHNEQSAMARIHTTTTRYRSH